MNEIILEPNIFQRDIYDFIRDENRGNLIVRALAGTGKTYTGIESLNLIPRNKKVIFLAYNRHIVTELEGKAPDWVEVRTTHATGLSTIKNFNIGKTTNHWDHNYKMFNILREIIKEDNVKFKKKRNDAEIISDAKFSRIRSGIVNIVNHFRNSLLVVNMYEMEYITDRYDIDFKEVEITQERIFKLVEEVLKRDMQDTLSVDYGDMVYLPTMMMMEFERYDFVFVDECLPGRTRILLSNGEEKTISEIVEKQLSVDVVSYNTKTKNRQNKKIIGWSKKPTNNKVMLKITHAEKRKVPENDEEYYPHHILFCTDNHLVFTKEHGFVHSSDLKPGKHVKSESAHGSSCWSEIIFVEEVEYKEEFVYDIEIEDNHNFYAEGVLVHNCQDLNESQLRMLLMLKKPNGRIIAIGDTNQCVIEGTKISTSKGLKCVEDITTKDQVLCGTGNVATIFTPVQDVFKKEVDNTPVIKIKTSSGKEIITTPEHIHFARYQDGYKTGSTNRNFLVYLMYKEDLGYRVGFTKSHKARVNQENADKVWFLDSVKTLREANYLEQFYSVKYGLPRWIFRTSLDNVSYTKEDIKNLFSSLNTKSGAMELLKSKNMFLEYPHHIPKCSTLKRRRNFSITMCGDWKQEKDGRKNPTMHRYCITGSDVEDGELLKSIGMNVRQAKTPGSWRVESSSTKLGDIYEKVNQIQKVMDINLIETARLGNRALSLTPASHVLPGMGIFVDENGEIIEDEVIDVSQELYTGSIFDINVDRYHNSVANGIVTHNSLYAFRGADTNAMEKIKLATDAEELPLNICYRCPKIQIKLAQDYVPEMEYAPDAIDGEVRVISGDIMHKYIKPGDLAICRNNAPLVSPALSLLKLGIKVNIRGQNLKKSMIDLIKKTKTNDLLIMTDMIIDYRETEAERLKQEGKNPVSMLDKVGVILEFAKESEDVNDLIHYIDTLMNDKDKEITFSTIHSAKGLEAENIFFINSWLIPTTWASKDWEFQGERNIMYVALTRAKNRTYFVDIHDEPPTEAIVNRIEKRNERITEAINEVFNEQQQEEITNDVPPPTVGFDKDYLKKILEKENGKRRS